MSGGRVSVITRFDDDVVDENTEDLSGHSP